MLYFLHLYLLFIYILNLNYIYIASSFFCFSLEQSMPNLNHLNTNINTTNYLFFCLQLFSSKLNLTCLNDLSELNDLFRYFIIKLMKREEVHVLLA